MDCFSPRQFGWSQHRSRPRGDAYWTVATFKKAIAACRPDPPKNNTPTLGSFYVLGALNIPGIALLRTLLGVVVVGTLRKFQSDEELAQSYTGLHSKAKNDQTIEKILSDEELKPKFMLAVLRATTPYMNMLALRPWPWAKYRPWTILTSHFTHIEVPHFTRNMALLFLLAPACSQLHCFTKWDVLFLSLGASIFSSAASLINLQEVINKPDHGLVEDSIYCMGFSAINAAFMAFLAMASPRAPLKVDLVVTQIWTSIWVVAVPMVVGDVQGLLGHKASQRIPYLAHMAGGLFGVLYYFLDFRYKQRSQTHTDPTTKPPHASTEE